MLIGIGQRTIWAPPETVTATVAEGTQAGPLTVIDAGLLAGHPEGLELTVRADGDFLLAVGRAADVEAWVGDAVAAHISDAGEGSLEARFSGGAETTVPNPAGSDLWVSEEALSGEAQYSWDAPAEGDWEILLASDGTAPAPMDISATWPNDASTPWSLPLIVGGAVLAVLGLVLALLRRGSNPPSATGRRAGAAAPQKDTVGAAAVRGTTASFEARPLGRAATASVAAVLALAVLPAPAHAAGTPSPAASGETAGEKAEVPMLLESQLTRILDSVAGVAQAADAAKDPAKLPDRMSDGALELRKANYQAAAKLPDVAAPAPVAADQVLATAVPGSLGFPRSVVVLTQGQDNPVPQALLLVQKSARENYKLASAIQMLPATTFPQPPAAGTPSESLPADADGGLVMAPAAAVDAMADVLTNPDGAHKDTFAANTFAEAVTTFQQDVKANPDNEFANVSFKHSAVQDRTAALRTADGGAIVFGYMSHTYASTPREAGDSIRLEGTVYETLTGKKQTDKGIEVGYGEAVMLYVPAAGSSGQVQVVGAAQELISAKLL